MNQQMNQDQAKAARGLRLRGLAAELEAMPVDLAQQTLRERHRQVGDSQFVFEMRSLEAARKANVAGRAPGAGAGRTDHTRNGTMRSVFGVDSGSAGTAATRPDPRPASNDQDYQQVLKASGATNPADQFSRGVANPGGTW